MFRAKKYSCPQEETRLILFIKKYLYYICIRYSYHLTMHINITRTNVSCKH